VRTRVSNWGKPERIAAPHWPGCQQAPSTLGPVMEMVPSRTSPSDWVCGAMTSCTLIGGAGAAAAEDDIEAPAIYSGGRMRKNLICCRLECCCVYKSTGKTSFRFHLEFLGFSFLLTTRKHLITFSGFFFLFSWFFIICGTSPGFFCFDNPPRPAVQRIQLILQHKARTDGPTDVQTSALSAQAVEVFGSIPAGPSRQGLVIADPASFHNSPDLDDFLPDIVKRLLKLLLCSTRQQEEKTIQLIRARHSGLTYFRQADGPAECVDERPPARPEVHRAKFNKIDARRQMERRRSCELGLLPPPDSSNQFNKKIPAGGKKGKHGPDVVSDSSPKHIETAFSDCKKLGCRLSARRPSRELGERNGENGAAPK
jgi:hypothetical protein